MGLAAGVRIVTVVGMVTLQYLSGELSARLGDLESITRNRELARDVARLRHEAETTPPTALRWVTLSALELADRVCWDSLARSDGALFDRQAAMSADLHEWGVCAGIVEE